MVFKTSSKHNELYEFKKNQKNHEKYLEDIKNGDFNK